uniref:Putative capsid protein n=1 Tax=Fringilla montifringilla CRESS-DNA-virus sp. TaxID=2815044 RepID=A0A8A4XAY7_9VIRU|nr:MAG: putative capsid protein [Fringilla montifringilla CRESS-DNA-virus sp.]
MVYKRKVAKRKVVRRRPRTMMTKKTSFTKKVKSVISRMAENKNASFRGSIPLYMYGAANWGNSITVCTPETLFLSIQQGVGQGDRIGNSIRVKSLKMTGVLRAMPYNLTTNQTPVPCFVKFLFMTRKDTPTQVYGGLSDLLQYGDSAEGPGNSANIRSLYRPVNTDVWTYHTTRIYKLGFASNSGTGAVAGSAYLANNDFKLCQFVNIDLTKYCTKIIKWNDNITDPSTRNVVLYPILYTADGTILNGNSPVNFDYALDITYEDM